MSRPLRIELDDAVYQVMARGNARDRIFFDDQDRQTFLEGLRQSASRFVFDRAGRHLRTENTLTGQTVLTFARDAEGRLLEAPDDAPKAPDTHVSEFSCAARADWRQPCCGNGAILWQ